MSEVIKNLASIRPQNRERREEKPQNRERREEKPQNREGGEEKPGSRLQFNEHQIK